MRQSPTSPLARTSFTILAATIATFGCAPPANQPAQTSTVERTTSGDTTIVRNNLPDPATGVRTLVPVLTIGRTDGPEESAFGVIRFLVTAPDSTIWIYDSQLKSLRVYDHNGAFLRRVGRAGDGPGEYATVRGMATLGSDKVILCVPRGPSIVLFNLAGKHLGDWKLADHGVSSSCDRLFPDSARNVHVMTNLPWLAAPASEKVAAIASGDPADEPRIAGYVAIAPDGAVLDSTVAPYFGFAAPRIVATSPADIREVSNWYAPRETFTFGTHGYPLWGRTDKYAIHLLHRDGKITRIERVIEPVPWLPAEAEENVAATVAEPRCADPRWTHPEFPANKVFFRSMMMGNDGAIWVQVSTPGELMPDAEVNSSSMRSDCPATRPLKRYRERVAFDVFAATGEFLGRVQLPPKSEVLALERDFIWLRTLDENDVQSATKFRLEPALVYPLSK